MMNKMCLTLLKLAKPLMGNKSLRVIRKRFSWDLEKNLSLILNTFDDNAIKDALKIADGKTKKG